MTSSALTPTLISSVPELEAFLSSIPPSSTLYLDLEGNSLSRYGTISLITILIHPQRVVRLIDVLVLGKSAFTAASNNGKTLKSIFEDPDIPKCAWDVRNDADALWAATERRPSSRISYLFPRFSYLAVWNLSLITQSNLSAAMAI